MDKYSSSNVGIQLLYGDDLTKFLGNQAIKHNPTNKVGLCISIGDKFGPIENWNKVYEAKTILFPQCTLKQDNHLWN